MSRPLSIAIPSRRRPKERTALRVRPLQMPEVPVLADPQMRADWATFDLMGHREMDAVFAPEDDPAAAPGEESRVGDGPADDPQYSPRLMVRAPFGVASPQLPDQLMPVADTIAANFFS